MKRVVIKNFKCFPEVAKVLGEWRAARELARAFRYISENGAIFDTDATLNGAFLWEDGPQGSAFWADIALGINPVPVKNKVKKEKVKKPKFIQQFREACEPYDSYIINYMIVNNRTGKTILRVRQPCATSLGEGGVYMADKKDMEVLVDARQLINLDNGDFYYDWLANKSVWRDCFKTKKLEDVVVMVFPHKYALTYTAMIALRFWEYSFRLNSFKFFMDGGATGDEAYVLSHAFEVVNGVALCRGAIHQSGHTTPSSNQLIKSDSLRSFLEQSFEYKDDSEKIDTRHRYFDSLLSAKGWDISEKLFNYTFEGEVGEEDKGLFAKAVILSKPKRYMQIKTEQVGKYLEYFRKTVGHKL